MRKLIAISFSLLLFVGSTSQGMAYCFFKINQSKIAKTTCVQKTVENNTCQGKCVFTSVMNNIFGQESDSIPALPVLEEPSQLIAVAQILSNTNSLSIQKGNSLGFATQFLKTQSFYKSVFHPPDFA